MKNKGFTLIELVAIIVVLVTIFLVSFPALRNTLKSDNKRAYNDMVDNLCLAGESYIYSNQKEFPELSTTGSQIYLNITTLINSGMVDKNIKDPNTNKKVNSDFVVFDVLSDNSLECEYKKGLCFVINDEKTKGVFDVGDEIMCGTEKFYVIETDSNNVQLLTKYRISKDTLIQVTESESQKEIDAYHNFQDKRMEAIKNSVTFSSTAYWLEGYDPSNANHSASGIYSTKSKYTPAGTSGYKYVYDDSIEDAKNPNYVSYYVVQYENKLKNIGADVIESKLMSYEQAIALGCKNSEADINYGGNCNVAQYPWLITTTYWLGSYAGTPKSNNEYYPRIWSIDTDGSFDMPKYSESGNNLYHGTRPVITLNKSQIQFQNK